MELLTTRKNVVAVGVSLLTKTRNSAALSMDVKVSRFSIDLTPSTTKIAYHSLVWLSRNMVTVVKLVSRKWILFPVLDLRPNHLKIFAIFEIFFYKFYAIYQLSHSSIFPDRLLRVHFLPQKY